MRRPDRQREITTVMTKSDTQAILDALLDRCEVITTPCGDGHMTWRAWNAGRYDLPIVVLLHGGFGGWNHWVRNIPTLEKTHRVIAADLPGCGDSAEAPRPYTGASLAEILSTGLDIAIPGEEAFDLVSFSFGGIVSGLLAHAQARRIRSLTLVGSPVLGLTGTGPANDLVEVPRDLPPEESAPLYRRNLQNLMVHAPEAVDELAMTLHMANMAKARLRSRGIARTSVLADSLVDLPCRLNCIFGAGDVTLHPDLEGVRAYVEEIHPGVDFRVIPNAGHWVQYEAADAFNEVLPEVLDR
jgi:2-hydroxy-6-oxonona-2,4-dienedioate hydrolase